MVKYNRTSPYADTPIINDSYLDRLSIRPIPAQSNDILYTIEPQYNHRPDLLAFDLYNFWNYGGCLHRETWMCFKTLCLTLNQASKSTYLRSLN